MQRPQPLVTGETYHIFNRGAHKQNIFACEADYQRFKVGMYITNNSKPALVRPVLNAKKYRELFSVYPVDKTLVDVLGYALMPNHFHLIIRQKTDGGITLFMKKLVGGYSMYFNLKYDHKGTLFQGPFKSSHIDSEAYFKWIFAYVHLNPVSLVESRWKEGKLSRPVATWDFLKQYQHASFYDFYSAQRPERSILAYQEAEGYIDATEDMAALLNHFKIYRELFSVYSVENS